MNDNPKAKAHYGKKILVVNKLSDRDFNAEVIKTRQPGAKGTIIGHSDSHGLCFKVKHDDGTLSCYDPDELMEATTLYIPLAGEPRTMAMPMYRCLYRLRRLHPPL